METIKERRTAVLQDTIQYYTQDPTGRRCKDREVCRYSPKTIDKEATSEGCAVGRLLPTELQELLDRDFEGTGVSNDHLFYALPQDIQDLGQTFLVRLQMLHDSDDYWDTDGLSEYGRVYVQHIEKNFCM